MSLQRVEPRATPENASTTPPSDRGYADGSAPAGSFKRGYYNVDGSGANAYCRYVGDSPNTFMACRVGTQDLALSTAGMDQGYASTRGFYKTPSGEVMFCRGVGMNPSDPDMACVPVPYDKSKQYHLMGSVGKASSVTNAPAPAPTSTPTSTPTSGAGSGASTSPPANTSVGAQLIDCSTCVAPQVCNTERTACVTPATTSTTTSTTTTTTSTTTTTTSTASSTFDCSTCKFPQTCNAEKSKCVPDMQKIGPIIAVVGAVVVVVLIVGAITAGKKYRENE